MPLRATVPTLPARSVAWPDADWFAPSASSVTGAPMLPDATPDRASVAAKVTITGPLFQPAAFAVGAASAVTIGAVLSMLTVTLAVAVFPAWSVTVPDTTWFAPSALETTGGGHEPMPDPV